MIVWGIGDVLAVVLITVFFTVIVIAWIDECIKALIKKIRKIVRGEGEVE